jgi:hypothetical protein
LEKEGKQRKKDIFSIKAVNLFRGKNDKIKLRETNSFSDHVRLYKYRSHGPLSWDIRPKINWNKPNVDSIISLNKK